VLVAAVEAVRPLLGKVAQVVAAQVLFFKQPLVTGLSIQAVEVARVITQRAAPAALALSSLKYLTT
jgi:hypothetical protein